MLQDILILCHTIEKTAEKAYQVIASRTEVDEQISFWQDICTDEKRHIAYWEQLLKLEKNGYLQNPFDNTTQVLAELNAMKDNILEMSTGRMLSSNFSDSILWAFRLESYMLHPAFAILFHVLRAETGGKSQ